MNVELLEEVDRFEIILIAVEDPPPDEDEDARSPGRPRALADFLLTRAAGFDPLDAASTPAPVAAPALSPPSLTLLAIILAAVAFAGIRSSQRSSRPDRARSAFGWWGSSV